MAESDELVIFHPNREKATSKLSKFIVIVLLLASAALVAIVTIGGWSELQGAQPVSIAYILVYPLMAYYVARWKRGLLPLAAAMAIVLLVFAVISTMGWFARSHAGFTNPGLPPDLIGTFTALLVPVEFLLIAFGMSAFSQAWNVEIEMTQEEADRRRGSGGRGSRGYRTQAQT